MKHLTLYSLDANDHLVQPNECHQQELSTAAIHWLTDFQQHQPSLLEAETPATEALMMLEREHSTLKLVVDANEELIGLISPQQVSAQSIMRRVVMGEARDEITVRDLMLPRSRLKAVAYQDLLRSKISDVLSTLQREGEAFCLVLDRNSHQIRGVLSSEAIAKRLQLPLKVTPAPTFLQLFDSVLA
ncbi:CBS domain-containing protein [Alkalimonas amylolytica]|uniref:CBS domain-containing protein n=1 Tax=Alkalimonas amylolytica TaxID=152573 RepID=A0A1H4FUJ1_ALKAM|nr:CBS domain-containing protein [Alkalimonas amylolytica]SEB00767.1 CBS domain-containing protein [Alkalimonas amylolytica]